MKSIDHTRLSVVAFALVILSTAGCREKKPQPIQAQVPAKPAPAAPAAAAAPETAVTDVTLARWSDIKDDTYDHRAHFQAGLQRLVAKVAVQIAELNAKRATMQGTTSTTEWDFAMKEMTLAQSYLAGLEDEVNKATPDTWDQKKDKVGAAWTRTQDAYDKVKHSTTS